MLVVDFTAHCRYEVFIDLDPQEMWQTKGLSYGAHLQQPANETRGSRGMPFWVLGLRGLGLRTPI